MLRTDTTGSRARISGNHIRCAHDNLTHSRHSNRIAQHRIVLSSWHRPGAVFLSITFRQRSCSGLQMVDFCVSVCRHLSSLSLSLCGAGCPRILRCICRDLAPGAQPKRGQKRRTLDDDKGSSARDTAEPERENLHQSQEQQLRGVLNDICSAIENDVGRDATGEAYLTCANDRTRQPVCLVRQPVATSREFMTAKGCVR